MKKILMALVFTAFVYSGAEAQDKKCVCPAKKKVTKSVAVRKPATGKGVLVKKTVTKTTLVPPNNNLTVCREQDGYYVCCQYPNNTNFTYPNW